MTHTSFHLCLPSELSIVTESVKWEADAIERQLGDAWRLPGTMFQVHVDAISDQLVEGWIELDDPFGCPLAFELRYLVAVSGLVPVLHHPSETDEGSESFFVS
jgi:hypothetical protein